tara:strand:- start:903 stop:1022 length:120 start_codon:yes stop_codon:yes gene_type:complete
MRVANGNEVSFRYLSFCNYPRKILSLILADIEKPVVANG